MYSPSRNPVPWTGKNWSNNYYKTYFRIVKTTNEQRSFYACEDKSLIRGARRPNILWKTFDDVGRTQQRSWKKQTKTRRQHKFDQRKIRRFKRFYAEELLEEDL